MTQDTREDGAKEAEVRRVVAGEEARPASPFPRYERISEALADEATAHGDSREIEIPRTESFGELWQRAQRRRLGR
jgi:hypothetical protein